MRYHWDKPVEQRYVHVAECEHCEGKVIVLLSPIVTQEGQMVGYQVNCTKCFVMLNHDRTIDVDCLENHELFQQTGSRILPHYNRYNPKVSPFMRNWLEMRWRHV